MIATLTGVVRRAAAAAFSLLLLAGPPYLLLRFTEPPLPDQPPTWDTVVTTLTGRLSDDMILTVLTALLWAAWASFVWSLLAELATALTGRRLPQPRALTPARGLATLLVTMITGSVLATAAHAATAPPAAHARPTAAAAVTTGTDEQAVARTADTARTSSSPAGTAQARALADIPVTLVANGRQYTHTVRRGDTLSKIAQQWLGDADRWPEIFALNRGTHYPHVGGTLRNPDIIHPGWTLDLPDDATPPAGHRPHRPAPPPEPPAPPIPAPAAPTPSSPPPATAPSGSTVAPGESTQATPDHGSSRPSRADRGVSLPTGSWIDVGLAAAIIAAVALVWAHRQRRYRPRTPPGPRPDGEPAAAPIPRVVRQIRRGLHADATAVHLPHLDPPETNDSEAVDAPPGGDHDADICPTTSPVGAVAATPTAGLAGLDAGPVAPALAHPLSAVWPPAGLGLTGPGADAAARGFLTAALATSGDEPPEARPTVIIPAGTAATLLGAAAIDLPRTPRLTVTADLDEALTTLEHQTLHRSRLVYDHEVDTVDAVRAADPSEETLAPIMLIADASSRHGRTRISALLAQGQRLDIHAVFLGAWPDGDNAIVAADGTVTRAPTDARHGPHPADVGRLAVLDPTETVDLLGTLAESHTGHPPAPAPVEPAPPQPDPHHDPATRTTTPEPGPIDQEPPDPETPDTAAGPQPDTAGDDVAGQPDTARTGNHPEPQTPNAPPEPESPTDALDARTPEAGADDTSASRAEPAADDPPHPDTSPWQTEQAAAGASAAARVERVKVTVLGRPALVDASHPRRLRTKSLELLVYLAARDGTASTEEILEDLLPEAPSSRALHRLHTYVSDLRAVLRQHAGPGSYLTNPHHHYRLNPDRFDIDLWRLRAALRAPGNDHTRLPALRRAVDHYRPLAEGCDYEWLDAYRHTAQRDALDAVTALLDAYHDNPNEQAAVCAAALPHHPYNEQLYQQAMRAHAALGDLDAIRALRRTLTQRLNDIDAEPTEETLHLAHQLIDGIRPQHLPRPSDRRSA
ncbi:MULTISPECIES: BTAD domain-containing putative transcriptional regulator [unclassified Micromonospora]|uniref:BTAD domain-containing putative transcriptional regulator n=1 Tax=unclassified Micromonospora TaxID=2617518 RepID=UPI001C21F485|nr:MULTISPECIES: BTAD domain-containing putative transcriptional regulator [unclassified Micromonospora]MBU8857773.1 LysM peptidoglycan-binding domain-containing protein [Micromonospora sp. WMMB482]MDM4783402.1 LysM peptidoglycan-binding domain-containing protein [Micromonospora sp. b486]